MNCWIVYNGALKVKKMDDLIERLSKCAESLGIFAETIPNNQFFPFFNINGNPDIYVNSKIKNPDFVIFWDKDIFLAKHLELMGLRLFNSASAIEICDNKALTYQHLAGKNLPIPKTVVAPFVFHKQNLDKNYYSILTQMLGDKLVLKESCGSFGMQVYLSENEDSFFEIVDRIGNNHFIIQEFIKESCGLDVRVNIIGEKIVGSIKRTNPKDFRANISLGGNAELISISDEVASLAIKAHKECGLDFSGVDILFGEKEKPILCEVNSNVNFLSFENATGIDFAKELFIYITEKIENEKNS